ncbi:MAG: ATP-dependent protease ATPase subunit HslU [Mariprofundaceae bacterium]
MTPREIVSELDRFIIGQKDAKRAVAIALRNRWRRQQIPSPMHEEITPKNILMIGPTGVGKTEIARRLARLAKAPFVKIEATKFTEVGYVGRDVESMIRDLVDSSIKMVREEFLIQVQARADEAAEERLLDILIPHPVQPSGPVSADQKNTSLEASREKMRQRLRKGSIDERQVEIEVSSSSKNPVLEIFTGQGNEEVDLNLKDMFGNMLSSQRKHKRMPVREALQYLKQEEADRLLDMDQIKQEAINRAENSGIIFLDEIDKITNRSNSGGSADVSRQGVQRDLLPLVEGTTVNTRYGQVRTNHILFIASGAFHLAKPSDLAPELQGRLPIRVTLDALSEKDFCRILVEPESSLTRQYVALLATEGIKVKFREDGVSELARLAARVNEQTENIGARRLHTLLERVLEQISFEAPDQKKKTLLVNAAYVRKQLKDISDNEDLSRYIL